MTFIVYGVGAIGGTVAARLALAGQPVAGIARGGQLEAVRSRGLTFRTPDADHHIRLVCRADPTELDIGPGDTILLTVKGQDTAAALERLRAAGVSDQPIFCMQNGVVNERLALRLFPNVYGVTVMMPATFINPGEVVAFGAPRAGIFDIGRYPSGLDGTASALAETLDAAGFAAFTTDRVMQSKYGKLLMNLGNIVDAAYGTAARTGPIAAAARREGEAVLKAAGILWKDTGAADPRRDTLMRTRSVEGAARVGSSSAQSLARGAGSIETDFLNGEVVLQGRLHGVPVPVNAWLTGLAYRMVAEARPPATMPIAEAMSALAPHLD